MRRQEHAFIRFREVFSDYGCAVTNFWLGRSVLVTGGTGLIGRWLTCVLASAGASVSAIHWKQAPPASSENEDSFAHVDWVNGSVADAAFLESVFAKSQPEIVFHLAARSLTGAAESDPAATLETNVRGVWILFEACRRHCVRSVVVASSGQVYAPAMASPLDEESLLGGELPYSASKNCAEIITRMYAHSFQVPAIILRFSNVFGGGDNNFSRLIPGVIQSALRGERFLIRGDGQSVRDLLYIEDGVSAFLRGAESLFSDPSLAGHAFNIAQGKRWSILEITETLLAMLQCSHLRPIVQNVVKRESRHQHLDISKAWHYLGWRPYIEVLEGLRRTVDWYVKHATGAEASHVPGVLAAGATDRYGDYS